MFDKNLLFKIGYVEDNASVLDMESGFILNYQIHKQEIGFTNDFELDMTFCFGDIPLPKNSTNLYGVAYLPFEYAVKQCESMRVKQDTSKVKFTYYIQPVNTKLLSEVDRKQFCIDYLEYSFALPVHEKKLA